MEVIEHYPKGSLLGKLACVLSDKDLTTKAGQTCTVYLHVYLHMYRGGETQLRHIIGGVVNYTRKAGGWEQDET